MESVRSAASLLLNFLGPPLVLILGVAVVLGVIQEGAGDEPAAGAQAAGRVSVADDGQTIRVVLDAAGPDAPTKLLIQGTDGGELGTLLTYADTSFTFERSGMDPVGFVVHRDRDQGLQVGVAVAGSRYALSARPDGSADVVAVDAATRPRRREWFPAPGSATPQRAEPVVP